MSEVKYENGFISLRLNVFDDLIDSLEEHEAVELIESLSCADVVIDHVMNQVFDGWTASGYNGDVSSPSCYVPTSGLNAARERVAKHSSDVALKTIDDLRKALLAKQAEVSGLYAKLREVNQWRSNSIFE